MNDLMVIEKLAHWEKLKMLVLDSVSSPITKRVYNMALNEFLAWFQQAPRPGFTKATVSAWRVSLEDRKLGSSSIIIRMSAIRKLAAEAADNGLLAPELAAGISRVKSAKCVGIRVGNWGAAGAGPPERARYRHAARAARPRDSCRSSGLRSPAVRGGRAHIRARSAARRSLVHRGLGRQTRAGPHRPDADLASPASRPTTSAEPARSFAGPGAASLSRSNCCSATPQSRPRSGTWARGRTSFMRLTTRSN